MIGLIHPLEFEPRLRLIICDEFNIMANTTLSEGKSGYEQNLAFASLGSKRVILTNNWKILNIRATIPCIF